MKKKVSLILTASFIYVSNKNSLVIWFIPADNNGQDPVLSKSTKKVKEKIEIKQRA